MDHWAHVFTLALGFSEPSSGLFKLNCELGSLQNSAYMKFNKTHLHTGYYACPTTLRGPARYQNPGLPCTTGHQLSLKKDFAKMEMTPIRPIRQNF